MKKILTSFSFKKIISLISTSLSQYRKPQLRSYFSTNALCCSNTSPNRVAPYILKFIKSVYCFHTGFFSADCLVWKHSLFSKNIFCKRFKKIINGTREAAGRQGLISLDRH